MKDTELIYSSNGTDPSKMEQVIRIAGECRDSLIEKKCENPKLLDLRAVNSYLDFFLICTGSSRLHCRGLAKEAELVMERNGIKLISRPDYDSEWIVLDFNEIIVHIFTADMRDYYNLERLWGDAVQL